MKKNISFFLALFFLVFEASAQDFTKAPKTPTSIERDNQTRFIANKSMKAIDDAMVDVLMDREWVMDIEFDKALRRRHAYKFIQCIPKGGFFKSLGMIDVAYTLSERKEGTSIRLVFSAAQCSFSKEELQSTYKIFWGTIGKTLLIENLELEPSELN